MWARMSVGGKKWGSVCTYDLEKKIENEVKGQILGRPGRLLERFKPK